MSGNNQHITSYTAAYIQQYLKGELPASESHDLERAALEDPFLADAIEGLALHPVLDPLVPLEEDLSALRERLAARTNRRKQIPFFRPIPVAAALILLIGVAFTFFFLTNGHQQKQAPMLAARQTNTPSQSTLTRRTPSDSGHSSVAATNQPRPPASVADRKQGRPPKSPSFVAAETTSKAFKSDSEVVLKDLAAAPSSVEVKIQPNSKPNAQPNYQFTFQQPGRQKSNPAAFSADSAYLASAYSAKQSTLEKTLNKSLSDTLLYPPLALSNATFRHLDTTRGLTGYYSGDFAKTAGFVIYRGVVTDQRNRPIPGASVSLNNLAGYGTTTDANGQFNFSVRPADSVGLLTISSVGYDKQFMPVNTLSTSGTKDNIIRLSQQTGNFDEVVVVGYGAHRKETKVASPFGNGENVDSLWARAAPVVGRLAYLDYIANVKNKLGLDSTIHGTETVSFVVNRDGTLTLFRIEQSLSPAHDAGVVRLVTEGPSWHILGSRAARASVTVRF